MNRIAIWIAMQNDAVAVRLVQIASRHVSLALEHGGREKRQWREKK